MFNIPFPPSWVFWLSSVGFCLTWAAITSYFFRNSWRSRNPNNYDLRHFRHISVTDAPDGKSFTKDGANCHYILYKEQYVHSCESFMGEGIVPKEHVSPGDDFFPTMLQVSLAYLRILSCLTMAVKGRPQVVETNYAQLTLTEREQAVLEGHKQYAWLTVEYAMDHDVLFGLKRTSDSTVRITLDYFE